MRQFLLFALASCLISCAFERCNAQDKAPAPVASSEKKEASAKEHWHDLLEKEAFKKNWTVTEFGGEGEVSLNDGVLKLQSGTPVTGVNWKGADFPKDDYEIRWKAQRTKGSDFLACLTFPVGKEFCSVVVGGWGGGVVGISSVNGSDASENETTQFMSFDNNKWYDFHLSVTPAQIVFKVNDKVMVELEREGRKFDTRIEVIRSRPFGYCTYQCDVEVKDFEYRVLSDKVPSENSQSSSKPRFMRVLSDDKDTLQAFQTAIAKYEITSGPYAGAQIDLVGAVHVGDKAYYGELNKRFKEYDAVLFELVADPKIRLAGRKDTEGVINPVSSMQVGMKDALELAFQLDEVDYDAKNFVHADMTPTEFMEDMDKRKDSFVNMFARVLGSSIAAQSSQSGQDAALLAAMLSPNRALALRRVFAMQMETADAQLAGIADANGQSTLVTERNAKAMKVLEEQLKKGKRKFAIFYGAAHLDDMHQRLIDDFKAKLVETEWLDAWALR